MNIFDSKRKPRWAGKGISLDGTNIILSESSIAKHDLGPITLKSKIDIVAKKKSGNGCIGIRVVLSDNSILFEEEFFISSNSWTEKFFDIFPDIDSNVPCHIQLYRPAGSIGRVEVARIILKTDSDFYKKQEKIEQDDSTVDYIVKNYSNFSMKIAIIVPYGIYGGAEVYLKNILSAMDKKFLKIDIIYLHENKLSQEIAHKNISHIRCNGQSALSAALINNEYDAIIYYNSVSVYNTINRLASNASIFSKTLEIYHSDFMWSDSLAALKERESTDKIFRTSKNLLLNLESHAEIIDMPVGIDIKKYRRKDSSNLKASLNMPSLGRIFGTVARMSPEKNLFYFLKLAELMPSDTFVLVGSGPQEAELKRYCLSSGIKNVRFVGFRNDVENFYSIFDAFILTSKMEGTPISILEAMASECIVFTTNVGRISDIIKDKNTGFFLKNDPNYDVKLINNNFNKKSVAKEARDYVVDNHNIKLIAERFLEEIIYEPKYFSKKFENFSSVIIDGSYI